MSKETTSIGRTVVVGVDGSSGAADAALLGRRIATASDGSLHLVAAASQVLAQVAATRAGLDPSRLEAALLEAARAKAAAGLADAFDAATLAEVLSTRLGPPEHVLMQVGQELGADLFVLGGHRRPRPLSWVRRGTAHRLLRVAESPVLVTGSEGSSIDRVVVAVDRSFAAAPTISAACRIAALLEVSLAAVHVVRKPTLPTEIAVELDLDALLDAEEATARSQLRALLPDNVDLATPRGDVTSSLLDAVEGAPATLLVLGAQGLGWIHRFVVGSTTQALLAELPTSLLIVPSSPPAPSANGQ